MNDKYKDIIHINYDGPKYHKKMTNAQRAAQFMPFAALTGYDTSIHEAARSTTNKKELSEQKLNELDYTLQALSTKKESNVEVTYFVKDNLKNGGEYITKKLTLSKINFDKHALIFENGEMIQIEDILDINVLDKENL